MTTRRLQVTLNEACAEIMRRLRRRYETSQESTRMAIGIADVVVDAWDKGWPVLIERPNGTYRMTERRHDPIRSGRPSPQRVLSAVHLEYLGARKGR